jgi:hypothetical protein
VDHEAVKARVLFGPTDDGDTPKEGESFLSDWLPWTTSRRAHQRKRGWDPLQKDEQVLVLCPDGDMTRGVILESLNYFNTKGRNGDRRFGAPSKAPNVEQEVWLNEDGTKITGLHEFVWDKLNRWVLNEDHSMLWEIGKKPLPTKVVPAGKDDKYNLTVADTAKPEDILSFFRLDKDRFEVSVGVEDNCRFVIDGKGARIEWRTNKTDEQPKSFFDFNGKEKRASLNLDEGNVVQDWSSVEGNPHIQLLVNGEDVSFLLNKEAVQAAVKNNAFLTLREKSFEAEVRDEAVRLLVNDKGFAAMVAQSVIDLLKNGEAFATGRIQVPGSSLTVAKDKIEGKSPEILLNEVKVGDPMSAPPVSNAKGKPEELEELLEADARFPAQEIDDPTTGKGPLYNETR